MAKKSDVEKVQEAAAQTQTAAPKGLPDLSGLTYASSTIWKPEEGEYTLGIYDGRELLPEEHKLKDAPKDKDIYIHFIIDQESGQRVSFVPGTMADKWIISAGIEKGDTVFAKFDGVGQTRDGNKVNNWDIRYKKA